MDSRHRMWTNLKYDGLWHFRLSVQGPEICDYADGCGDTYRFDAAAEDLQDALTSAMSRAMCTFPELMGVSPIVLSKLMQMEPRAYSQRVDWSSGKDETQVVKGVCLEDGKIVFEVQYDIPKRVQKYLKMYLDRIKDPEFKKEYPGTWKEEE